MNWERLEVVSMKCPHAQVDFISNIKWLSDMDSNHD